LRGPLRTLLQDTLSADGGRNGLFRPAALETLVRQHLKRRANFGYQLWGLMLLLLWMKRWSIQMPQTLAAQPIPESISTST
jgi:asparagine synthase (glutamine-hydrolysing)